MSEREMRAFTLAPLPVLALTLLMSMGAAVRHLSGSGFLASLVGTVILAALLYGAILLIGVPIHLLLRRLRKAALLYYLGLAVLPILLPGIGLALRARATLKPLSLDENPHSLSQMWASGGIETTLVFAAIAALSASTFWYAGVRQPRS